MTIFLILLVFALLCVAYGKAFTEFLWAMLWVLVFMVIVTVAVV